MSRAAVVEGRVVAAAGLQLRDVEVSGNGPYRWLEGRAVPYGTPANLGWYTEIVEAGVFAKSIREAANGLPLLLFHDAGSLDAHIGKADRWNEETDGLHGVWKLSEADNAQRAAQMVRDGLLGYFSVGFQPIRSTTQFDDDDNVTIIRHEARLLEVSLVSTPAYASATATKVRTAEVSLHEEAAGRRIKGWREYLDRVKSS